ncbi:MAG: hypothetical protein K2M95_05430 [Clostridiales bacterium]|nr:hypothetical protein [Clostridiales bacterium]
MEKSIIEEIYFNDLRLSERLSSSKEYKKISDEAYGFYERLNDILNDEQKKIFEDFTNSESSACAEGWLFHFKEGIKVGLLLAMECLL